MKISIGNLTITDFCKQNIEHMKFRKELAQDELVYEFVSINMEQDLHEVLDQEKVTLGNAYIIQDDDKLVGYIYIEKIEEKVVELRYAVHPKYRRLGNPNIQRTGYGQQILEECRNYLFTLDDIDMIDLHIRKDNDASIGCAEKAKYKRIGTNEEYYYYIYRTKKGESQL